MEFLDDCNTLCMNTHIHTHIIYWHTHAHVGHIMHICFLLVLQFFMAQGYDGLVDSGCVHESKEVEEDVNEFLEILRCTYKSTRVVLERKIVRSVPFLCTSTCRTSNPRY